MQGESHDVEQYLATIDELSVRPFGEPWSDQSGNNAGGRDFHLRALREAGNTLEDLGDDAFSAVRKEFTREQDVLVRAMTARLGEPEIVHVLLWFYEDAPKPDLYQHLCDYTLTGDLYRWRLGRRYAGVALGHPSEQHPLVLLAVVTDGSVPAVRDDGTSAGGTVE